MSYRFADSFNTMHGHRNVKFFSYSSFPDHSKRVRNKRITADVKANDNAFNIKTSTLLSSAPAAATEVAALMLPLPPQQNITPQTKPRNYTGITGFTFRSIYPLILKQIPNGIEPGRSLRRQLLHRLKNCG
jgi:hypothetical protein